MRWAVTDPPFTPLTYSIQAFLWWDTQWRGVNMDWIQRMVFSHVKQTFAWSDIEPERGQWDFSNGDAILEGLEARQLSVVARLTNTPYWALPNQSLPEGVLDAPAENIEDWANFCRVIAERYRGRIDAYQLWNEPNLTREWGGLPPNAGELVRFIAACSEAIRSVDPDAILISPGLAPTGTYDATAVPDDIFLQQMYDHNFQNYINVVGVHAPGYSAPEVPPEEGSGGHRFFTFRRVEDMRRIMVANGDAARQMAILEMGWTTDQIDPDYAWYAVDEAQQAENLVAAFQYAADHWRPWIGLMSVIYISDPRWTEENEEYWWSVALSIAFPYGYTRPAYMELANMAKYCGDDYRPPRDPGSPEALGLAPVRPCN